MFEVRRKNSIAKKGRKQPHVTERNKINNPSKRSEVRDKISKSKLGEKNPMYGKKRLDMIDKMSGDNSPTKRIEVRKKMSISRKGRKLYKQHRKNISEARKGNKNPMFGLKGPLSPSWKGGISYEPYCPLWSDKEYKNWIKLERDKNICQNPLCSGKFNKTCLHHINYDKKDCRPVNLITVCNSCNSVANGDREWHKAFYKEIIRRKYLK